MHLRYGPYDIGIDLMIDMTVLIENDLKIDQKKTVYPQSRFSFLEPPRRLAKIQHHFGLTCIIHELFNKIQDYSMSYSS